MKCCPSIEWSVDSFLIVSADTECIEIVECMERPSHNSYYEDYSLSIKAIYCYALGRIREIWVRSPAPAILAKNTGIVISMESNCLLSHRYLTLPRNSLRG